MTFEQWLIRLENSSVFASFTGGVAMCRFGKLYHSNQWFRWTIKFGATGMSLVTFAVIAIGISLIHRAYSFDLAVVRNFGRTIRVVDSGNRLVGVIGEEGRVLLAREEIPNTFIVALLAAEDSNFYGHCGFDPQAIIRSAWTNLRKGEVDQGGSTITQQLARNTFPIGGRTLKRKLIELILALRIERKYSKDEIICQYLNRIYFGSGFYGLGSAANGYFGKNAGELNLVESGMLAGLIRSPNSLSPLNNRDASLRSLEHVLDRIEKVGWLSEKYRDSLKNSPVTLAGEGENSHWGRPVYLLSRIEEELERLPCMESVSYAVVRTSLDLNLQRASESSLHRGISLVENQEKTSDGGDVGKQKNAVPARRDLQGASLMIQQATGRILAAVPSRDRQKSHYDRIRLSKRPPGFAFAPIVYAAAYESGVATPLTGVFDIPMDNSLIMLGGTSGILGEWSAVSFTDRYLGEIPSGFALIAGKQAATARLGFQVGLDRVGSMAQALGIKTPLRSYPSSFLGATEMSLEELTHSYATIANQGKRANELTLIDAVFSASGEVLFQRIKNSGDFSEAISPQTADRIRTLLKESLIERVKVSRFAGKVADDEFGITGTSNGFQDNWVIGGNGEYTWGVWMGMDIPEPIYDKSSARDTVLPVWMEMAECLRGRLTHVWFSREQMEEFTRPQEEMPSPRTVNMQSDSGERRENTFSESVIPKVAPISGVDVYRALESPETYQLNRIPYDSTAHP